MSDFLQPTPYEPDQFDNQPVANGEDDAQRERERIELFNRINDAIGQASPVLAEVLSYFPDEGRQFAEVQEYAARETGKAAIWYSIPRSGSDEQLDTFKLGLAKTALGYIRLIEEIRGIRAFQREERKFYGNTELIRDILKMGGSELDPKSFQYKIILTVMKVMNLSNAEITSMHDYVSAVEQSESLRLSAEQKRNDAKRLIEEASSLDSQAQRVIQNAREKIASDCFIDK